MTYLTRMDLALGSLLDHVFSLSRGFQPVEVARLLRRTALRQERRTLKASYVPNAYAVGLAAEDFQRLEPIQDEVVADLSLSLKSFLSRQRYQTLGPLSVNLEPDPDMERGRVRVLALFQPEA